MPEARLLVIGRGTRHEEVAAAPARRLGIADRVVFAGYRGDDYPEVLRQMEVLTFLVPGSDGTCRALLEAAACAIPAVVSERGALPEIVLHRETGLVVPEDPDALAAAWRELLSHPERCADLGRAAYERAQAEFTPARLADAAEALYADAVRETSSR
jgi:glycosyltransferase involved in cell wall biosynthesis